MHPFAVYPGEAPTTRALELLQLAERLGSGPSLLPQARSARIQVTGWIQEIAGEAGFGWCARHLIFDNWARQMNPEVRAANPMFSAYGYDESSSRIHARKRAMLFTRSGRRADRRAQRAI